MTIPLTTKSLRDLCGSGSDLARATISALCHVLTPQIPDFVHWREDAFSHAKKVPDVKPILKQYELQPLTAEEMVFILQTYYALVVKLLATHHIGQGDLVPLADMESGDFFRGCGITNFIERPLYHWYLEAMDDSLSVAIADLQANIATFDTQSPAPDVLKALYEDLFPRKLRHSLGEYYTPDWLAEHLLDRTGFIGEGRILDPACGSGTFLVLALRRMQAIGLDQQTILRNLAGVDVNPLACLSAKANLLLNLTPAQHNITLPIHCADIILNPPDIAPVDFIVGNPPWINWETLPTTYREETQYLWWHYNLFPHSGMDAILGKGKKDLSLLLTYACIDHYLVMGGKLGFLLTKTVLKTNGAGTGFRRFKVNGVPLQVCCVDDFGTMKIFPPASTNTIALIMCNGKPTHYPVPYHIWRKSRERKGLNPSSSLAQIKEQMRQMTFVAEPISAPDSAWLTGRAAAIEAVRCLCGLSEYQAHAGAYTGGANAVYWLDVLERTADGVRVRNIVEGSKRLVPQIETVLEPDFIFPLLRGRDVKRWEAIPTAHILIVQNPETRHGYPIAWLQEHYPRTFAYLQQFEPTLRDRAAYHRFFRENMPFYTMFDVGTYTFAPVKVVWKGFGTAQMRAAVITTQADKPIMTNQAMHPFIGLEDEDEAHYLAACLNSAPFEFAVLSHTQAGSKSFAQPGILKELRLPHFEPENGVHQHLADLSRNAHAGTPDDTSIAEATAHIWGLSPQQLRDVQESLTELRE